MYDILIRLISESNLFSKWIQKIMIISILIFFLIIIIKKEIDKWIINKTLRKIRNNSELDEFFFNDDVENKKKYFIPIKGKDSQPLEEMTADISKEVSIKSLLNKLLLYFKKIVTYNKCNSNEGVELISYFVKNVFKNKGNDRYFLIFADSGMGKTTLLINIYISYKRALLNPLFYPKYNIKYFHLGSKYTLDNINNIKDDEKKDTIILLDAFDEDILALKDSIKRLDTILEIAGKFKYTLISCRTQFYKSQNEEPVYTRHRVYEDRHKHFHQFKKIYLYPLNNKDIRRYLRKKISFIHFKKYFKALKITQKTSLFVRPMFLNDIENLVTSECKFEFSFQIYNELIKKWIQRESSKNTLIDLNSISEDVFKKKLYYFSEEMSVYLYLNKEKNGGYFLPQNKSFPISLFPIFKENTEQVLTEIIGRSKSLLNRDPHGNYKFSHKSIFEFFLAKKCLIDPSFYQNFVFEGMDDVLNFIKEQFISELRYHDGEFSIDNGNEKLSNLTLKKIDQIKYLKINGLNNIQIKMFKLFNNLEELILIDKKIFSEVYILYRFEIYKLKDWRERSEKLAKKEHEEWQKIKEPIEELIQQGFLKFGLRQNGSKILSSNPLMQQYFHERITLQKQIDHLKREKWEKLQKEIKMQEEKNLVEHNEIIKRQELIEWQELEKRINWQEHNNWQELEERINWQNRVDWKSKSRLDFLDRLELVEQNKQDEQQNLFDLLDKIKQQDKETFERISYADILLNEIQNLQKNMKRCRIYY